MGSPGAESSAGQALVGRTVIADPEQVRSVAMSAASSPLRRCARAERTGAAEGGERERLVAGGNSGELDRRMPEGCVAGGERAGRGGEGGRAVTYVAQPVLHVHHRPVAVLGLLRSKDTSGWCRIIRFIAEIVDIDVE